MTGKKRHLTATMTAAALLLLSGCTSGPSADEKAADAALTAWFDENPSAELTEATREGPWEDDGDYAFLIHGNHASQNGTSLARKARNGLSRRKQASALKTGNGSSPCSAASGWKLTP
jgi:hypothetical protein